MPDTVHAMKATSESASSTRLPVRASVGLEKAVRRASATQSACRAACTTKTTNRPRPSHSCSAIPVTAGFATTA